MGEFRDRMERDLQIRGFSRSTQQCYLARMKAMVRFFMRPPDELTLEDIHTYQLHLTRDRKVCWAAFNQSVGAIRFFYGVTLNRDWEVQRIPYQKTGRKLPVVLSGEGVSKLFQVVTNLKHRSILMTAYAGGLRVSEVTHLRVSDVDGQRMMLRFEQQKSWFPDRLPGHVLMVREGPFCERITDGLSADGRSGSRALAAIEAWPRRFPRRRLRRLKRLLWKSDLPVAWIDETGRRPGNISERALALRWAPRQSSAVPAQPTLSAMRPVPVEA